MSEFTNDFSDAYRDDVSSILELGEELSLLHSPNLNIRGRFSTQDQEATVNGQPYTEDVLDTSEGMDRQAILDAGMRSVDSFARRVKIHMLGTELPSSEGADGYTPEQETRAQEAVATAHELVDEADYNYSEYFFRDELSGEDILVTVTSMGGEGYLIHAREIVINTSDDLVKKTIRLSEMPATFQGGKVVAAEQSMGPIYDKTFGEAAKIFTENGTPEDVDVLVDLFQSEVLGTGNTELLAEDMLRRYSESNSLLSLMQIIEEIRQKAQATILSSNFKAQNPGFASPSLSDLKKYKNLLSMARS